MPLLLTLRNHPGGASRDQAELALQAGEAVIGRGEGVQFLLSSPMVSRRHCTVSGSGDAWHVTDTSTGGTLVNGQRIGGPQALRHGDVLTVGDMEIVVTLGQAGRAAAQAAPRDGWGRPAQGAAPAPAPHADMVTQARTSQSRAAYAQTPPQAPARPLLQGADPRTLATAEAALAASVAGLNAMLKARGKARDELGVAAEEGKARLLAQDIPPAEILKRLLALGPEKAKTEIAEAEHLMEQHRRALLAAMQAALHAALDHFAPQSIRQRTHSDAAAWQAFERAFSAQDGFVEVFAEELRKAYENPPGD